MGKQSIGWGKYSCANCGLDQVGRHKALADDKGSIYFVCMPECAS